MIASQYQYLFVGGILGEVLSLSFVASYFKETQSLLEAQGAKHVTIYQPNSFKTAEDNARELSAEITRLWQTNGQQVILFCHSKGCLEAMFSLLESPDLFRTAVHRVFCVQPPFKGSSLTEKRPGVLRSRIVNRAYRASAKVWPGIRCLKKNAYTSYFEKMSQNRSDLVALVAEKVVTVKGAKYDAERVAWILKVSHQLLWQGGNETDGLLSLRDQEMPGFKVQEVKIPMDHSDLFTSAKISNEDRAFKSRVLNQLLSLA
jgi:hypothetical protein